MGKEHVNTNGDIPTIKKYRVTFDQVAFASIIVGAISEEDAFDIANNSFYAQQDLFADNPPPGWEVTFRDYEIDIREEEPATARASEATEARQ